MTGTEELELLEQRDAAKVWMKIYRFAAIVLVILSFWCLGLVFVRTLEHNADKAKIERLTVERNILIEAKGCQ